MADQDRVDVGHLLGDQGRGVLRVGQRIAVRRRGVRTRVGGDHDDVAAELLQLRHEDLRLLDQTREVDLPRDVRAVPDGDARVGEPEDADLEVRTLRHPELLDDVRREHRQAGSGVDRIGPEQRVGQLLLEGTEQRDAVVELVVAERCRVVPDQVHGVGHRVHAAGGDRLDLGEVVGERRSLDGVAGVEDEQRVAADPLALRLDQGLHLGDADVVVGGVVVLGVLVVVPVEDVPVEIGRAEDRQPGGVVVVAGRRGGSDRGRRVAGGGESGCAGEDAAS